MPKACTQIHRAFSPSGKIKISLPSRVRSCCSVEGKHTIHLQSLILTLSAGELALLNVIIRH